MSCNYRPLYSLPCRKPYNRYVSVDDVFEGAVPIQMESYGYEPTVEGFEGAYEPTVSREGYGYEPTVEGYGNKKVVKNKTNIQASNSKRVNTVQACNCQPQFVVMREEYQDPSESDNCGCAPMNRPYRIEQCGYNASPSMDWHYSNPRPQPVIQESMEPGMEKPGCGCELAAPVYKNPECAEYNQSQTWKDQTMFRENIQNKN